MNLTLARGDMSVKELANRVGVSHQAIYYYESGKKRPSPEIATRIGEVLGLSKEELWEMFYDKDSKEQTSHDKPADLPDP